MEVFNTWGQSKGWYTGMPLAFIAFPLEKYKVKASDRNYQLWERNPLNIETLHGEIELHS